MTKLQYFICMLLMKHKHTPKMWDYFYTTKDTEMLSEFLEKLQKK